MNAKWAAHSGDQHGAATAARFLEHYLGKDFFRSEYKEDITGMPHCNHLDS